MNKNAQNLIGKVYYEPLKTEPSKGHRAYFVCTYAPKEEIQDIFAYCKSFAWITHDKDVNEDGTPKAVHSHFIVRYNDNITPTALAKKFFKLAPNEQTIISPLGDKDCAIDYMLHRDEKSVAKCKTLYKECEILTDDSAYYLRTKDSKQQKKNNEEFLADLLNGDKTYREMAVEYGRDYIKNYKAYEAFAYEVHRQEYEKNTPQADLEQIEETKNDIALIAYKIIQDLIPQIRANKEYNPTIDYINYRVQLYYKN